jgi:methylated-DNA-protein-cysteine methyltransferase-like protein
MNQNSKTNNDNFFEKVYEVALLVPIGRVTSYGAIARYLGSAQSARMVGWALNVCHTYHKWVPAHRVVNKVGQLTGKIHFPGSNTMQEMLESEGVKVEDNTVVNFEKLFWDPNIELE